MTNNKKPDVRYFGAKISDIIAMILRVADNSQYVHIRDSLEGNTKTDEEISEFLEAQPLAFQSWLFEAMSYKGFTVDKAIMNDERRWELRIEILSPIRKVNRRYRICFHYDPRGIIDRISELEHDIKGIQESPTLLKQEDEKKIKSKRMAIADLKEDLEHDFEKCPPLSFECRVKENKFPPKAIKIHAVIPSFVIQNFIENEYIFEKYSIRLEPISEFD